jgi:polyferredoxin
VAAEVQVEHRIEAQPAVPRRPGAERIRVQPGRKPSRRIAHDHSQRLRQTYQIVFLLLNIWLGLDFYAWVRRFETASPAPLVRPAGIDGWLPIAGLMNLRYWLLTGRIPQIHPAAMFLLIAFLSIAFLFRKAFCSWLCPVGTVSEYLSIIGRKIFRRNFSLPRGLDISLRGLKYLLLAFFLWAVGTMSADAIEQFMYSPFGIIADVKMLNFFRFLSITALAVIAVLVVTSLLVQNFWCRYLCPYGALLGIVSALSPLRVRRNAADCIDCAKCTKECPAVLPVDKLVIVRSSECTACMACVAACPVEGALHMSLPKILAPRRGASKVPAWALALGIALLFLGILGVAKTANAWNSHVPASVYYRLVPRANEAQHPMGY